MSVGELGEMIGDEFLHRRGLLAADSFDQVVVAREDSVLVVDGDVAQMLRQELGKALGFDAFDPRRDVGGLVAHGPSQRFGDGVGDLVVVHLDRAEQWVNLAGVVVGVLKDRRDHPSLVFGRDRGVAPVAEGEPQHALLADPFGAENGEPLSEIRWAQMCHRDRRPVQDPLSQPVDARRVACGTAAGRDLRHVDDRGDSGLLGGLGEGGGCLEQAWADRVDEVGRPNAVDGLADSVDVLQIADDDLGATVTQFRGAVVKAMHEGAHAVTAFEQQSRVVPAGSAGRSGSKHRRLIGATRRCGLTGHRSSLSSQSFARSSYVGTVTASYSKVKPQVVMIYAHYGSSEAGNKLPRSWQNPPGRGGPDQPGADGLAVASLLAFREKRSGATYAISDLAR